MEGSPSRGSKQLTDTGVQANAAIPILDTSAVIAGRPGAVDALGAELRTALQDIGFYYLIGHGVDSALVDAAFDACRRFHAQPLAAKMALRANEHNVGYMPVNGYVSRSSRISVSKSPNCFLPKCPAATCVINDLVRTPVPTPVCAGTARASNWDGLPNETIIAASERAAKKRG